MARMSKVVSKVVLAGFLCAAASTVARADEAPAANPLTVNAFGSMSYTYNLDRPDSRKNQFRIFDVDHNSIDVDALELVVQKPVKDPRDVGFRADVVLGETVPVVSSSAGLFQGQNADLQQAFVSWIAPVGSGLRLDAGKFISPTGAEVIEGYDGWNWNYSHSFLFGYAIPYAHTGLKASYAFSDKVQAMVMVVNGWDVAVDNNAGKTGGAQLTLAPGGGVTIYLAYLGGPEQRGSNSNLRHLGDLVVNWASASGKLAATLNVDFGYEQNASVAMPPGPVTTKNVSWHGFAAYARWVPCADFALNLRGEAFDDSDGARTTVGQKLTEVTLTPEYKLGGAMILRADLRFDLSNRQVFDDGAGKSDKQFTIGLNAIYYK